MNWAVEFSRIYPPAGAQANLYGVIIYSNRHPHVVKLLADDTYWRALDELSGLRWCVFAVRAKAGIYEESKQRRGALWTMVQVWKDPSENTELLGAFEIGSTEKPLLVVFAEGERGEVLRAVLPIRETSVEDAFKSLREAICTVSKCVEEIHDENRRQGDRAFFVVKYGIDGYKDWQVVKRAIAVWQWFKSLQ